MRIAGSPYIFQENMSSLMETLEYVRVYLDDILTITKGTYKDHLTKLGNVLIFLRDANLCVNINRSLFAKDEVEYLGYVLNRKGIKPMDEKVSAIHA